MGRSFYFVMCLNGFGYSIWVFNVSEERGFFMKLSDVIEPIEAVNCNLSGSSFTNVNLSGILIENANLSQGRINNASLSEVQLTDANLSGMSISDSNLEGMTINGILVSDMIAAYEGGR